MMLAIRSNRDEFSLLIPYVRFTRQAVQDAPLLVDTNIIIDGRVQAVCAAGFLSGCLVVPRFVLEELQASRIPAIPSAGSAASAASTTSKKCVARPGWK